MRSLSAAIIPVFAFLPSLLGQGALDLIGPPPSANAGLNQTVKVAQIVTLDGSGSSDPSGRTLTYDWRLTSRPAGSATVLINSSTVRPTFLVDAPGDYIASLTVSNGVDTSTATVTVSTSNTAPVANAGANQTVGVGATVTLNGSGSVDADGNALTYHWTLMGVPAGSSASLVGATSVSPTFVADLAGQYVVRLIVNDGVSDSSPSTVTVTTQNSAPVAKAGPAQVVQVGTLVHLNGSGSTDVDGDPLSYQWSLVSVPGGSTAVLSSTTAVNPTFTVDRDGTYVAQLIVNDGKVSSLPSTVSITTNAIQPPVGNAGPNQTVPQNTLVSLNGTGSDPQGLALTYQWALITKPAGSAAVLSSTTIPSPTFLTDMAGTYVVQLIVNNGFLNSAASTVTITTASNTPPLANAGPNQIVSVGATVTLNGNGSSDADGNSLTFSWSLLSRPGASGAVLIGANTPTPHFVVDVAGTYVAQLIVNDGFANSAPSTVVIDAAAVSPSAVDATSISRTANPLQPSAASAGPVVGGVTPAGGTGSNQSFSFTFTDSAGWQDLGVVNVLISDALDARNACYLAYVVQSNTLLLVNDAGAAGGPYAGVFALNNSGSASNTQCSVNGVGSSASGSGNTLTLTLNLTFTAAFAGNRIVYAAARDTGAGNSGWQAVGTWKVPGATPNGPAVGGVNPAHSTTLTQAYTFTFTDTNGWQDLAVLNVLIQSALDGRHACYLAFVPASATSGTVLLLNDLGTTPYSVLSLPGAGTAQNSQCIINGTSSSVSASGNSLVLTLAITFDPSFAGNRVIYLAARSNTLNSGWQPVGTASVPAGSQGPPPASIEANNGTPQSTVAGTTFAAPFVALVKDATDNPVSGVLVTFSAPGGGASGTFAGGVNTATTNALGLATSAAFTANATIGLYSVTASVTGVATAASFSLINSGPPNAISAQSGTPQHAAVNTSFAVPFTVVVIDAAGNPVRGNTVTFRAPFAGVTGTFPGGGNTTTAITDASGVARSAVFTANDLIGSYIVTGTAAGLAVPANFDVTNTAADSGTIQLTAASVGKGLETAIDLTLLKLQLDPSDNTLKLLPSPAVGNVQVTLTSSDPSKLLLSGRSSDPGGPSLVVGVSDGSSSLTGIYIHGLVNSGTVSVSASATGYNDGGAIMTLTPSGFVVAGPAGTGAPFAVNQGTHPSLTVMSVQLDASLNIIQPQLLRAGTFASVSIVSSNTAVGTVTTSPLGFQGGNNFSQDPTAWVNISSVTTPFNAVATGSTTLSVSVPAGFSTPAQGKTLAASVNAIGLSAPNVTVGKSLETTAQVTLIGTAPAGGALMTVTSNNPGQVLLSNTATAAGSASIVVPVPEFLSLSAAFYVQGVGNLGSSTYTATLTGFGSSTGTITIGPSGFVVAGPIGLGEDLATTTAAGNSTFTVFPVLINGSITPMPLAGGLSANVPVTSSNSGVGSITASPVTLTGGVSSGTTGFHPNSPGSTIVSITQPSGFSSPGSYQSVLVSVITPGMVVTDGISVGQNLEIQASVGLGATAPAGGVTITLTSNSGQLKLSTTGTAAGASSIQLTVPAGGTSASFYIQSLGSSGTATYTAVAPGFSNRTGTITLTPSGPVIAGPFGLGTSFFQPSVAAGNVTLTIYMAQLDPANNYVTVQSLIGGLSVPLTLTSSATGFGTIVSPVTLTGGPASSNGVTSQFHPVSPGSTLITVQTPAGYSTPNIAIGLPSAQITGQVGP